MHKSKHKILLAAGLLALGVGQYVHAEGMRTLVPADPKAYHRDPALPYGNKVLDLQGKADQEGTHLYRVRMPSGMKISPHKYGKDQMVTVVKGILWLGTGERYNPMKMQELYAGSAVSIPAGTPIYNWARTEVILLVLSEGGAQSAPQYLNPDDDPRQQ